MPVYCDSCGGAASVGLASQVPVIPIEKYCTWTIRPENTTSIHSEFKNSILGVSDDAIKRKYFLSSLDDEHFPYAGAFYKITDVKGMKSYFLQLTWSQQAKRNELEAIKKSKFDPNGQGTVENFLIKSYIRLQDCQATNNDFMDIMNEKLKAVGKSTLVCETVETRPLSNKATANEMIRTVMHSNDLEWYSNDLEWYSNDIWSGFVNSYIRILILNQKICRCVEK